MDVWLKLFLLLFLSSTQYNGVSGYATCWDGSNPQAYSGTISTTSTGNTCQYWTSNSPHSHAFTSDSYYPLDGSAANAKNYCRDPDNDSQNWCYTTNPAIRWEYCDIPLCTETPCDGSETVGAVDPGSKTTNLGTNSGTNYLMKSTNFTLTCCGTISQWSLVARRAGSVKMQVWRPQSSGTHVLMGENSFSYNAGEAGTTLLTETVVQSQRISVRVGDLIGWYTAGQDMISSSPGTLNQNIARSMGTPAINDSVDFSTSSTAETSTDYAVAVAVAISITPRFTNTLTTVTVPQSTSVGTTVYTLSATDDDTDDISTLTYLFEESDYFNIVANTAHIVVRSALAPGTFTLTARVVDSCLFENNQDVTFTVYNEAPVFHNWTNAVTTSALNTSSGHVVHRVTVTDAENDSLTLTLTCTSCPFDVNNNGDIYATQNLLLHKVTSYDITITANDGTTAVTSNSLTISISDTNLKPNFLNVDGSGNVLESDTVGTQVFQISYNDGNGDTVTYSATFSPSGCSAFYSIGTDGRITTLTTQDYDTATVKSCVITVTMFDGRETSDPGIVTLTLQDVNEPPVFSAATYTITTAEVAGGTALSGAGISASDPEGQPVSYSRNCGSYSSNIGIDSSTAAVTMTTEYDLDPTTQASFVIQCTLTAADPSSVSADAVLSVTVTDVNDNSPVFSTGMYTFTIPSSTSPGNVGNAAATDADTTSPNNQISYSLSGDAKFTVDASGNIVLTGNVSNDTPITSYPLVLTATDGGGRQTNVNVMVLVSDAQDSNENQTSFFSFWENIVWFAASLCLMCGAAALAGFLAARSGGKYPCTRHKNRLRVTPKQSKQAAALEQKPNINNASDSVKNERFRSKQDGPFAHYSKQTDIYPSGPRTPPKVYESTFMNKSYDGYSGNAREPIRAMETEFRPKVPLHDNFNGKISPSNITIAGIRAK